MAFVAPLRAVCQLSLPPRAGRTEQSLKQKVWTTHPLSVHRGKVARYAMLPEAPLRGRESEHLSAREVSSEACLSCACWGVGGEQDQNKGCWGRGAALLNWPVQLYQGLLFRLARVAGQANCTLSSPVSTKKHRSAH